MASTSSESLLAKVVIPDWLYQVQNDYQLDTKTVSDIFGRHVNAIHAAIKIGRFPQPISGSRGVGKKLFWTQLSILNYYEELKNNSRPPTTNKFGIGKSKVCTKCLVEKHIDDFYTSSTGKLGRASRCKLCQLSDISLKYATDISYRDKTKENCKNWKLTNRVKIVEYGKKYKLDNLDKRRQYSRDYLQKNKSKVNLKTKLWRENNKDYVQIYNSKRITNLPDSMVRHSLARQVGVRAELIPQELVEVARVQILIKRKVKEMQNGK